MTFYFYDLETSGFSARHNRIMQFAGQRTDLELNPIGQMDNLLIKMTPDVLPDPGAVLVHGITPQKTLSEGISETEFCHYITTQVFSKDTIAVGYNNIRFDNEFIRFTLWRNFHDAYEWSWKDGCSTWDLLDVVRMTRALRPEGINWPFRPDGKPTNSLEYITALNKLDHQDAHDAASDVRASMAVAGLLRQKQPKIFDYLLNIRSKNKVRPFVTKGDPIFYSSGRYPDEFYKTTVAAMVAEKPDGSGALMYDLRIDPDEFKDRSSAELAKLWADRSENAAYFPVKVLSYNRCPAIAPLDILEDGYNRLSLHQELVNNHLYKLQKAKGFEEKLLEAQERMWPKKQTQLLMDSLSVDSSLYEGFVSNSDRDRMSVVRAAKPEELSDLASDFSDERLQVLLPLYKARNFAASLNPTEEKNWQLYKRRRLLDSRIADTFFRRLDELKKTPGMNSAKQHLLKDLEDYGLSITKAI